MRNVLFLKSAVVFNPSSIVHSYYGKLILQNIYNDCGIINFPDNNNSSSSFKSNKKNLVKQVLVEQKLLKQW